MSEDTEPLTKDDEDLISRSYTDLQRVIANGSRPSSCSIPFPLREQLLDPVFVHINTLRGTITKLTDEQIKHLYPHLFEANRGDLSPEG